MRVLMIALAFFNAVLLVAMWWFSVRVDPWLLGLVVLLECVVVLSAVVRHDWWTLGAGAAGVAFALGLVWAGR